MPLTFVGVTCFGACATVSVIVVPLGFLAPASGSWSRTMPGSSVVGTLYLIWYWKPFRQLRLASSNLWFVTSGTAIGAAPLERMTVTVLSDGTAVRGRVLLADRVLVRNVVAEDSPGP